MKTASVVAVIVVIAVVIVGIMPGCGGGSGDTAMTSSLVAPADTSAVGPVDTTPMAQDSTISASAVPVLTLAIASSLNGTGTVKTTTLTKGELLNTAGTRVAMATITAGKAVFPLTGLALGHYYIRINSLNQDLVPTRITNTAIAMNQFVDTTLRNTVIGPLTNPTVKMKTFALGQAQHPVVAYTTGASQTRYAYAIQYLKTSPQQMQVRVLGKASLLSTVAAGGHHNFATWSMGPNSHGTSSSGCTGCHGSSKPASYASISTGNGWCYKCHYGPTGAGTAGMVDPLH